MAEGETQHATSRDPIEAVIQNSIHAMGARQHEVLMAIQAQIAEADKKNIEKFADLNATILEVKHVAETSLKSAEKSERILTGNGHPEEGIVSQLQTANAKIDVQAGKLSRIERFWWLALGAMVTALSTLGVHILEMKIVHS